MTVKVEGAEGADAGAAGASDTAFEDAFTNFAAPEGEAGAGAGAAAAAGAEGADAGAGGDGAAGAGGDGAAGAEGAAAGGADGAAAGDGAAGAGAGDGKDGAAAGAEGAAAAGADAAGAAGEAKPAATADDILAGLSKLIHERPAAETKPDAAAGAAGDGAAAEEPKIYSDEEQTFLDSYAKDWGDVQKGEALIRRSEYRQLLTYVFGEVAKFVAPIKETAEVLATRTHIQDIEASIPDYSDKLRDDVTAWAKEQPAYLQAAYNQVITAGTPDEVKDLVERYRASTGQSAKPAGGSEAGTTKPKDNELSEPAKKAAAALAPVESKRSAVLQPNDPSNFDDAWKQAAADLG